MSSVSSESSSRWVEASSSACKKPCVEEKPLKKRKCKKTKASSVESCGPTIFTCPTAPILGAATVSSDVLFTTTPGTTAPSFVIPVCTATPPATGAIFTSGVGYGTVVPFGGPGLITGIKVIAPGIINIAGTFVLKTATTTAPVNGFLIFTPTDVTIAPTVVPLLNVSVGIYTIPTSLASTAIVTPGVWTVSFCTAGTAPIAGVLVQGTLMTAIETPFPASSGPITFQCPVKGGCSGVPKSRAPCCAAPFA